jgi:putative hemolysin
MRIDRADSEAELLGRPVSNREIVQIVAGDFEVRLARTTAEIYAAQALRYRIFYEEMTAHPTPEMKALGRDFDPFDEVCDHLLVLDRRRGEGPEGIVGTYRLIRRTAAAKMGRFYSSSEYDIGPMINYPGEILELGRSADLRTAGRTHRRTSLAFSSLLACRALLTSGMIRACLDQTRVCT